ncbi:hypothetical protein MTO96_028826 [Rhipicephalus appendiculatus]
MRLKLSKCEFLKPEVQYHIISAAGLRPNPAKTEAVLEAPRTPSGQGTSELPRVNASRGHGLLSVGAVVGAEAEDCVGPATPRPQDLLQKQLKQKIRCDQGTRPRVLGHPGDQLFARNFRPGPAWLPAVVTEQRTSSMDVLLEDGRRLTRHLDHIRQPHEELSADNQKSGSPEATGLAPSLDVGQRQLTPDRLHDTESRQDPGEDVARETELAVTAPSTPVLRRSTRIRRPVSRYSP